MASNRSLGSLTLDLAVKTGQFTAGMTAAERAADKTFKGINKKAVAFGIALGSAITGAATALTALTMSAINNADALRDSSIQLGISTETLSAYSYAAQQTGTDLDSLSRGLKILSKNAADALKPTSEQARVFDALGISVVDATGNLKQLDQLVPEVADAFAQLEDGTQKAALAQSLFGKSGLELTEFLNSGSRGLAEFTDKARELGIIVGTDTANAADEFNDKLADLRAQVSGFGNQLAAELLPRLIELVDRFSEASKEGKVLGTTVKDIGSLFDVFVGQMDKANEVGESTRQMLFFLGNGFQHLLGALGSIDRYDLSGFFYSLKGAAADAKAAVLSGFGELQRADFSGVTASLGRGARNARGGSNRPETGGINRAALADALAGIGSPKAKGGGAGKSKAVDETKKLQEAYDEMIARQERTIALFGQEGEAAEVSYDIKTGVLSEYTTAQQQLLLSNAQRIDQQKELGELEDAADKRMRQESEIINQGIKATDEVIDQLEFELSLIGQRNSEIEKAITLRHLDANATDEQRQRVAELTDELIRASENQQFLDDFKEGLADAFVDFVSGAKSAKDAFGDFADALFKRALQFVADKAIEAMFDAFNGDGKIGGQASSGGGTWANLLGAFAGAFGGGKAGGGDVMPGKFYRVNESGMEMATVDGRDYLMTGSKGGTITPANKLGGVSQNNQFILAAPTSQRTQEQIAQRSAFELSQAQRRNG